MAEIEHEREDIEAWPDGSRLTVDKWRFDTIAPWIKGNYEVRCGTCDQIVVSNPLKQQAVIDYLSHAVAEMQRALMELSYFLGRARNGRT